jgi:two-component system, sensor histidine kinase
MAVAPCVPHNEQRRLAKLWSLNILDTPAECRFDRITRIAAKLFNVPTCLVSLVDADRQWFKSIVGLDAPETSREVSFCGHAILQDDIFEVSNALEHPLFKTNPLVLGPPNIRFYAGCPVPGPDGSYNIGTLCLLAPFPKTLTAEERAMFCDLADMVQKELFFKELSVAQDAALDASRSKSAFLASMSHEIRTPLNAIIGMAEMLEYSKLDDDQKDALGTISVASDSLLALINGILDFSKIESGALVLESVPFMVGTIAQNACMISRPSASRKGLEIVCNVDDNLATTVVLGDALRLQQALINLIGNAVKFTASGHVTVSARRLLPDMAIPKCLEETKACKQMETYANSLHLTASGSVASDSARDDSCTSIACDPISIWFSVEDTGVGIPPERLGAVFEPFVQAERNTTRQYGGTGLGLAITRDVVAMMHGQIGVESEYGHGTTFHFYVKLQQPCNASAVEQIKSNSPLTMNFRKMNSSGKLVMDNHDSGADVESDSKHTNSDGKPDTVQSGRTRTVLVVEDNPVNQKVIARQLKRIGVEYELACDGLEAVELLRKPHHYGLVFMDVQMPGLDGIEASRLVRQYEEENGMVQHTRIYAMTACSFDDDYKKCMVYMDGFISKPLRVAALKGALQENDIIDT